MKTAITILFDEEKQHWSWRCERAEDAQLVENFKKQMEDVTVSIPDSLEKFEPVSNGIESAIWHFLRGFSEQFCKYDCLSADQKTVEPL